MSDKPAGEWTVHQWKDGAGNPTSSYEIHEDSKLIVADLEKSECEEIATAHKAALAAEQERFMQAYRDATDAAVAKLSNLPASGEWTDHIDNTARVIAASVPCATGEFNERLEAVSDILRRTLTPHHKAALAAEQAKVQPLMDALIRLRKDIERGINRPSLIRSINTALKETK